MDDELRKRGTRQSLYLRHERAILGAAMVLMALLAWEGLERGWWADALRPLLGESAERLQLERIFISSPTLVASAAFRMFFVTGEIWRDIAWSSLGYGLGLALAIAIGIPLGLAALRLAIGRGMIGVVVGEIYGSAAGIGAMISQAGSRFQTDKVFVGVLTIVATGMILIEIVQRIERRVEARRPPVQV